MRSNRYLNGADYLMLAFDYELRRRHYAGYSCQILVELSAPLDPESLRQRLGAVLARFPFLAARPTGLLLPYWKLCHGTPTVRRHPDEPGIRERLFNEPLATHRGELLRFDLVGNDIVFTWAHVLMDARAAEHFLLELGRNDLAAVTDAPSIVELHPVAKQLAGARQATEYIDQFAKIPARPFRQPDRCVPPLLKYRIERFTVAETARIRDNATRTCGFLNLAQYDAAASIMELHRLHERLGSGSPSYVFAVPVGLRPKGSWTPLFSNQIAMLMQQVFPNQLDTLANTVTALKAQTEHALRHGHLSNYILLAEFSRYLPLPVCVAIMKRSLGGELASIFYGDAGTLNAPLLDFLGVPVVDVVHIGAVPEAPGLGVIFGRFRNQLRLTVIHATRMLKDDEAAVFAANLRQRLLTP